MTTSLLGWLLLAFGVANLTASVALFAHSAWRDVPAVWALLLGCYAVGLLALLHGAMR